MKSSALWKVEGTILLSSGENGANAQFVAEDFEEATAVAGEALRHGWGSPDLQVEVRSLRLVGEVLVRERGVP